MDKGATLLEVAHSDKLTYGISDFENQASAHKVFLSIYWMEDEVNNGGFTQFFMNHAAEAAPFLVQALNTIGALKTSSIVSRAITLAFPAGLPHDSAELRRMANDFSEKILQELDGLDREFFARPDNLTDLLFTFVTEHPDEFDVIG